MVTLTDKESRNFWAKVRKEDGGCWVWVGCKSAGYGHVRLRGAAHLAHRVSYEQAGIPIPEGLTIDHLCCNRACVNPAHLEVVTYSENLRRRPPVTVCRRGHSKPSGDCKLCGKERLEKWLTTYKQKHGQDYVPPCRRKG